MSQDSFLLELELLIHSSFQDRCALVREQDVRILINAHKVKEPITRIFALDLVVLASAPSFL